VANWDDGTVSVIDTVSRRVSHTVKVGRRPENIVVAPDGREVYVGSRSDELTVIETRRKQIHQVAIGGPVRDIAVTPDGKRVYLALDGAGLKWYSPGDGRVVTIPTTHCPHALALEPIRNQLWISYRCGGPGGTSSFDAIDVMDLTSERSVGTVNGLPRVGGSIAVVPSGHSCGLTAGIDASGPTTIMLIVPSPWEA
jgi:YVTN family beta-propeller protein